MDQIRENIESIRERIKEACETAGRSVDEVTLMGVTKTKPVEAAVAAYEAGIRVFGENRVQETEAKYPDFTAQFPQGELHLIGHLQSNKAKNIVPLVTWIDSIGKYKTAAAVNKECGKIGKEMNLLLEVNTSGEESKFGYPNRDALLADFDKILGLEYLTVRGLMTIGPLTDDTGRVRRAFADLRELYDELRKRYPGEKIDILSMGMSGDFELAIQEGSTIVRIGSTIFGARQQ